MRKKDTSCSIQSNQHASNLRQIKNLLMKKENIPLSPGLIDGKMGVAVFFFHYAEYKKEEKYKDYAISLIDDVQNQISSNTAINYVSGLTGIGTAIEYIAQQGLMDINTGKVLSDFDKILKALLTERILYLSVNDIIDIGKYFQFRFSYKEVSPKIKKIMEQLAYILSLHVTIRPKYSTRAVNWLTAFSKKYNSDTITKLLEKFSDVSLEELPDNDLYLRMNAFVGLDFLAQLNERHFSWKEII